MGRHRSPRALTPDMAVRLGTCPDVDLAMAWGVSVFQVEAWRRERSIKPWKRPRFNLLLGSMPDEEIARLEGVTRQAVQQRRKARRIGPWRKRP